jgi:hypothetical protein
MSYDDDFSGYHSRQGDLQNCRIYLYISWEYTSNISVDIWVHDIPQGYRPQLAAPPASNPPPGVDYHFEISVVEDPTQLVDGDIKLFETPFTVQGPPTKVVTSGFSKPSEASKAKTVAIL